MSAPKNINPGCGSSRGFQFPVSPVSVWGEAASELEVGVKKLLCAGAAWIKPIFLFHLSHPEGPGALPQTMGSVHLPWPSWFLHGAVFRCRLEHEGWDRRGAAGRNALSREAAQFIPRLCLAREALEGRVFLGVS